MFWFGFWMGAVFGPLLVCTVLFLLDWVIDWWHHPTIALGRKRAIINVARYVDLAESLAWLNQVGFEYKHLRGNWYYIWRRPENEA